MGEVEPIDGKTVLILGLGNTGQAVAARSKLMGLETLGVRANPKDTPHVDEVHSLNALDDLWDRADFLVVCVPLLESTRDLVSKTAFERLKPSTVVIDISRGGVVDEAALISALDTGAIRGAGLDVFSTEPLAKGHRLWDYENVIVTPHCSAVYPGWDLKSVEMFSDNLTRYREGQTLLNIVDPVRGY
jgi:phosphoglycerate dehydrogenase-like enzyme